MSKEPKPFNASLKYHLQNRKLQKKIKILEAESKKEKSSFRGKMKKILFIFAVSFVFYFYYKWDDIVFWCGQMRFSEITKQLRTNVFHQHEAVESIIKNLQKLREEKLFAVMFVMPFVGTSGVSKTYIANIIKQNYYSTFVHDVSKYDLVSKFEETYFDLLKNLDHCCNLVTIEDLTSTDIDLTVRFLAALPKHKVQLVIPIINTQLVDVVNKELQFSTNHDTTREIEFKFTAAGLQFESVFFHPLDKYQLETAIIQLMVQKNVDYDKCGHLIKDIVENHDVAVLGYKQLHNKLHLIWDCGLENTYAKDAQMERSAKEF